ncbi:MAG: helix-turn-helix domain-containing protein, partial [Desulfomonile sp.]
MAITGELISKNVRRLRLKKKLSQVEVASYAAVPQTQYKKIERGLCVPRVDTLQRIAEALDANFYEIIESQNCLKSVRFRARKKIRTREDVLIRVDRWLRCFNEIEELVKDKLEDRVAPMIERLHKLADEDRKPQAAAIIAREMLGVAEKEPIWDICGLFESGGIKVFPLWLASDNFFGLSVAKSDGGP